MPHEPGKKDDKLVASRPRPKREAVKRIRDYRIEAGGKKYQLLRGEFHRHTEISWDGGPDGSLEDMFRYAIDAAAMDWIGNGDHDNGAGREYSWWLMQKFTDAYTSPATSRRCSATSAASAIRTAIATACSPGAAFAPCRAWPRRRRRSRSAGVNPDDTKMLYRYLKELDGICASHTSATGMGTDWRDNDPQRRADRRDLPGRPHVLRVRGRPRSGYDPKGDKKPCQHRRLGAQGLHQSRPEGQGLPPRLRVVERSLVHAHFVLRRPGREARPAGHPRRDEEAALLRRHGQHHPRRAQRQAHHGR